MLRLICIFVFSLNYSALPAREIAPFDNGLTDVESLQGKAELLKKLGYRGMTWRPYKEGQTGATADILKALDEENLKLYATYVVLRASMDGCPISPRIIEGINALRGRDTIVWLTINGKTTDEIVRTAINEIAEIAAANGLRVALYPHVNFHIDTVDTCLRFARSIDKPHVGISFNLCHFLKQNDEARLEKTIKLAGDSLFLVSINGADSGDTQSMDWSRLIRPLGQGDFDTSKVLDLLDQVNYAGPILLQCYNIKQPASEHLAQSIQAWKTYTSGR